VFLCFLLEIVPFLEETLRFQELFISGVGVAPAENISNLSVIICNVRSHKIEEKLGAEPDVVLVGRGS
jgi:hypothetical protein